MSAALVPRVITVAICDEAFASDVEANVLTLENVRHGVVAESIPHVHSLNVYLLMSHYRPGSFSGNVRLMQERPAREGGDRMVRYGRFEIAFDGRHEYQAVVVPLEACVLDRAGYYTAEVRLAGDDLERRSPSPTSCPPICRPRRRRNSPGPRRPRSR